MTYIRSTLDDSYGVNGDLLTVNFIEYSKKKKIKKKTK